MQQSDIEITASCHEQDLVCNNWLFELQPAVILQFYKITFTAGYTFNQQFLYTRFRLFLISSPDLSDFFERASRARSHQI